MELDERIKIGNLADYYGNLLTEKQKEILLMYVNQNLSFNEIADELKITRQGAKDAVDKAVEALLEYESKLNFVARDEKLKKALTNAADNELKAKILSILEDK